MTCTQTGSFGCVARDKNVTCCQGNAGACAIGNSSEAGRGLSPVVSVCLVVRDLCQQGSTGDACLFSVKTHFRSLEFKGLPPGVFDDASNSERTSYHEFENKFNWES